MGVAAGRGFNVNIPWDGPDMGNGDYLSAFNQLLIPIAYEFNPDLIIVSAGFDAADGDPIGECRVTPECFAHMTSLLKAIAPLVLLLEGGYNLGSTAASTEACLRVLLGEQPGCLPGARFPSPCGWKAIEEARRVQSQFWRSLQPPAPTRLHEPAALCVGSASWSDRGWAAALGYPAALLPTGREARSGKEPRTHFGAASLAAHRWPSRPVKNPYPAHHP